MYVAPAPQASVVYIDQEPPNSIPRRGQIMRRKVHGKRVAETLALIARAFDGGRKRSVPVVTGLLMDSIRCARSIKGWETTHTHPKTAIACAENGEFPKSRVKSCPDYMVGPFGRARISTLMVARGRRRPTTTNTLTRAPALEPQWFTIDLSILLFYQPPVSAPRRTSPAQRRRLGTRNARE